MQKTDPAWFRNNDKISSKWRDLAKKVKKFNGIHSQKVQTWRSGMEDDDIMDEAMSQYRLEQCTHFPHIDS